MSRAEGGAPTIAVFGSSTIAQASEAGRTAFLVGRLLAERGVVVMNGGYGGVMEAVSRGAREAGGHVVGVTVRGFANRAPNPHLREERETPDLLERLRVLTAADGFLALPGGVGTLTEIFLVWNHLIMDLCPPVPLVIVGGGLAGVLYPGNENLGILPEHYEHIRFTQDPREGVELVLSRARAR